MESRTLVHVGIVLLLSSPPDAQQLDALKSEVAALWRTYGVMLSWLDYFEDCGSIGVIGRFDPPLDVLLRVVDDANDSVRRSRAADPPLGSILFARGVPGGTIRLRSAALERMLSDSTVAGWRLGALPPLLRGRAFGRAQGRVLAHEIGHVLLGADHTRRGLMRSSFSANDLITLARGHLRLTDDRAQGLQARLRRLDSSR